MMKTFKFTFVLVFAVALQQSNLHACSLIKITSHGKTIVGNNEDFSNPDTRIWFEPGNGKGFGVVYVGYDNMFPEGGINEAGLMFDAFGVNNKPLSDTTGKLPVFGLDLKRMIMKECSRVEQVGTLLDKYNLYFWSHSVWIFVDKEGNYLVADGDSRTMGKDAYFVQTNFRHSEIKDEKEITCWRYMKAMTLLKNRHEAATQYCASLMDSVHVPATLYTTVYDLDAGTIDLYYFHNYSKCIRFNIRDELKRGNRVLHIPELFPDTENPAYQGLRNLKAAFDSVAFILTPDDSVRRSTIISDLRKGPYTIHVLGNYGYESLHEGNIQKAMKLFALLIEFYPEAPEGYDFLGEAYMENTQYEFALANYKRSVQLDPENVNASQRIAALNKLMKK